MIFKRSKSVVKVGDLVLISIDFYVPALTSHLCNCCVVPFMAIELTHIKQASFQCALGLLSE
jgi:hypothetical protein